MKIITDHKWRDIVLGQDLTKKQRKEFDYITDEDFDYSGFVKYRGVIYDIGEFMFTDWADWHDYDGYMSDSFFSGVLIKLSEDGEQCKIATYLS